MRKRVTFVEHLEKENLFKNESGHVFMRSTESNKRRADGQQGRKMYRGTYINGSADGLHMKTTHMPKSLTSAAFLQSRQFLSAPRHPALTSGQRRYLCSIANVYSTEHMRRQMEQHYLNVLHTCVQSGQNPACRRRYQRGENRTFTKDAQKDAEARAKPQGQRKGSSSSSTVNSDVMLPKIVNK